MFRLAILEHGQQAAQHLARGNAPHPERGTGIVAHLFIGVTAGYVAANARRELPDPLDRILYPRGAQDVWFWLVVVGLGAVAAWRLLGARRTWLVPTVALLLQLPHAVVVYQGDTLEIPRHGILVAVMTRLSILLLALLVIDAVVGRSQIREIRNA